jgi:hypothetical protein
MGSWAKELQGLGGSSPEDPARPPTGIWAAIADISPVWLSAVKPGRSDVWLMLFSGMVPLPVNSWMRHFLNWNERRNIGNINI